MYKHSHRMSFLLQQNQYCSAVVEWTVDDEDFSLRSTHLKKSWTRCKNFRICGHTTLCETCAQKECEDSSIWKGICMQCVLLGYAVLPEEEISPEIEKDLMTRGHLSCRDGKIPFRVSEHVQKNPVVKAYLKGALQLPLYDEIVHLPEEQELQEVL